MFSSRFFGQITVIIYNLSLLLFLSILCKFSKSSGTHCNSICTVKKLMPNLICDLNIITLCCAFLEINIIFKENKMISNYHDYTHYTVPITKG